MNGPVKKILRFVGQAACLVLVAAGVLAALAASFCLLAMLIVWFQEGALQSADRTMVGWGVKWLLGSGVLIGVVWWLRGKIVPNQTTDDTFRPVEWKPGRLEKLIERFWGCAFVIWLATQLWAREPGSVFATVPRVAGWMTLGFLGLHAHIALHELGHLVAAWLLRLSPQKVQVGVGPLIWSRAFANGLLCEWRAWPNGGLVFAPDRRTEGFRTRQSLVIAAGPLADLLVLWSTYQLIQHAFGGLRASFSHGPGGLMFSVFFWLMVLLAIVGLVPRQVRIDRATMWSDGYLLLWLWTGSSLAYPELGYRSKWKGPLELLGSEGSRTLPPLERAERESPAPRAGLITFHEQRALLSSRLLRKSSSTFGPPV
jgi:hypothetical protein